MSDSSGGIGFAGALFLLFLGLKLGGVIDWRWLWVFAPIWIPLLIIIIIMFGVWIYVSILEYTTNRYNRRRRLRKW